MAGAEPNEGQLIPMTFLRNETVAMRIRTQEVYICVLGGQGAHHRGGRIIIYIRRPRQGRCLEHFRCHLLSKPAWRRRVRIR